jgi:hypothetical protein
MLKTDNDKWIYNWKDHTPRKGIGTYDNSICNTCGKLMYGCWDTVCWVCKDTSCYEHSYIIELEDENYWICQKCNNELVIYNGIDLSELDNYIII